MAKAKKASSKTSSTKELRGVALIERVIAHIEGGKSSIEIFEPRPIPDGVLATLTFGNGVALSPSMKRFFAFDVSWWMRKLGEFKTPEDPQFPTSSIAKVAGPAIGGGT